jgi:hypothetical protein
MYSIEWAWYTLNNLFCQAKKYLKITASERIKYRKVSAGEKK